MSKPVRLFCVGIVMLFGASAILQASELTDEEKANKDIVEWILAEGVNKHNPDAWDSVLAEDYVRHCDAMPPGMQELVGIDATKGFLVEHFRAFPDWTEEISQIVVEGDKVAAVCIGSGTMTGAFGPFEPTGKRVKVFDFMVHRFEDGKIAESWVCWDNVNFMTQAGLTPAGQVKRGDE